MSLPAVSDPAILRKVSASAFCARTGNLASQFAASASKHQDDVVALLEQGEPPPADRGHPDQLDQPLAPQANGIREGFEH